MNYILHYKSLLGNITLALNGNALIGLWFDGQKHFGTTLGDEYQEKPLPVFDRTAAWLDIYFDGRIPNFTLDIVLNDTDFRREVWDILLTIPYGKTITYGEIAAIIEQKRGVASISAQAFGGAVRRNPISIIVPCHRVIGSFQPTVSVNNSHRRTINFTSSRQLTSVNGSLTGYAGGIERKAALLRLEGIAL